MLKPRQIRLAELMVAEPQLTKEEYAERVGCNTSTIYVWRKLPEFQEYYHDLCEKTFRSYEALAVKKLMMGVLSNGRCYINLQRLYNS